jgi:uridine kinase
VHTCGRTVDHFPGPLFENTGLLTCFDLRPHPPGFLLRFPEDRDTPTLPTFREQPRLFEVFQEYEHWGHVLGLDDVGALNGLAAADEIDETIRVAEALHEKKVALIADRFVCCRPRVRVILISGPSASGKTTFSKRLAVQLRVNRLRTFTVSLDEYFYPRRGTPVAGGGLPNYEGLEALDVGLLNRHLRSLLAGRRVVLPHFDFRSGCRERGRTLELAPDSILILEGIHALDPALTPSIDHRAKFRIYVSALTHLNIDDLNRIPTSETRLLRRMVRDSLYRGYNAAETLRRWTSVHEGEKRFVFPFQEKADVMFNSALVFELAVLKHRAIPLLSRVRRGTPEHPQAAFLRSLLSYVRAVSDSDVPSNSILREFIGGSGFRY